MAEIIKTDVPFLFKETNSGAIINTNKTALDAHRARKKKQQLKMQKVDQLENEIAEMKSQVQAQTKSLHEIQDVLSQLASRIR
jgi:hypothetical protein